MDGDPAAPVAPDAAQPNGGAPEGAPESQGGLGDLYDLSSTPEELRPYAEDLLKQVNSNVERKFREHADYRKQWEPYEGIEGFSDLEPDDVKELVEFSQLASDPNQFETWWRGIGEELGYSMDGEPGGEPTGEPGDEPPAWAQGLIEKVENLEQNVGPLSEQVTQQTQQQIQQEAQSWVNSEFEKITSEHGELDQEAKDAVAAFASAFKDEDGSLQDDAIQKGFQRYLKLTGKAEGDLVDGKLANQPSPGIESGGADTTAEEFTDLKDPDLRSAVKARFAAAR